MKAFFTTYKRVCNNADELLFSLGRAGVVNSTCNESAIGKLTPNALFVHVSTLEALSPVLRLFEACARGYLGQVEGANIIKLHRAEPRISYISYPTFEYDPHPALASSLTVHLQTFRVRYNEFHSRVNPPAFTARSYSWLQIIRFIPNSLGSRGSRNRKGCMKTRAASAHVTAGMRRSRTRDSISRGIAYFT